MMEVNKEDGNRASSVKCGREDSERNGSCDAIHVEEMFPWIPKFEKVMRSVIGSKNHLLLERSITVYTKNLMGSIKTQCIGTREAVGLKHHVTNILTFFHFYWKDMIEHANDCKPYLAEMSVLLGIYIDLELKTLDCDKDVIRVAGKILTALWVYLHNSTEDIFRALLRVKLINKKYAKICDLIFKKSFGMVTQSVRCEQTDMAYVRYLLALKLWKKIKQKPDEKREVNNIASMILGHKMPRMREDLLQLLPKPPAGHKNETLWLLQPNLFNLKQARERFLVLEEETRRPISCEKFDLTRSDSETIDNFEAKVVYSEHDQHQTQLNRPSNESTVGKKPLNKVFPQGVEQPRNKIPNKYKEVIVVDLTEEDEVTEICDMQKTGKKKIKRKLEWLRFAKKQYRRRRKRDSSRTNKVEIADAHSTENSDCCNDKILFENMPISDDRVSESTETNVSLDKEDDIQRICSKIRDLNNSEDWNRFCDVSSSSVMEDRIIYLVKLLRLVGLNVKDPKLILNLIGGGTGDENGEENVVKQLSRKDEDSVITKSSIAKHRSKRKPSTVTNYTPKKREDCPSTTNLLGNHFSNDLGFLDRISQITRSLIYDENLFNVSSSAVSTTVLSDRIAEPCLSDDEKSTDKHVRLEKTDNRERKICDTNATISKADRGKEESMELRAKQTVATSTVDLPYSSEDSTKKLTMPVLSQKEKDDRKTKNEVHVDDFGNVDILDSILNGDMIMGDEQDILVENSESPAILPISKDNSNMLSCITEFLTQSEAERSLHNDASVSLPEGSLGTTGILNSLLDFDLTTMDSADFMYSNIQTVNPRLIKKNEKSEELERSPVSLPSRIEVDYTMTQRQKDERFSNEYNRDSAESVDLVGFGLNRNKNEEEEIFKLSKLDHDKVGDDQSKSMILNIPSSLRESSFISESRELPVSTKFSPDSSLYDFNVDSTEQQGPFPLDDNDLVSDEAICSTIGERETSPLSTSKVSLESSHSEMDVYDRVKEKNDNDHVRSAKFRTEIRRKLECNELERRQHKKSAEQDELFLRYSQLTCNPVGRNRSTDKTVSKIPVSSSCVRISYRSKESSPRSVYSTGRDVMNAHCQVNRRISLQSEKSSHRQKQQILINFHGKTRMPSIIFENNQKDECPVTILKSETPKSSRKRKIKGNRDTAVNDSPAYEIAKHELNGNMLIKPKARWLKLVKKQHPIEDSDFELTTDEEVLKKRRRIASDFYPLLDVDRLIYPVNTHRQEEQKLLRFVSEEDGAETEKRRRRHDDR